MKMWTVLLLAAAACEAPPAGEIPFAINATLVDAPPEGRIPAGVQPDGAAILPGGRRVSPAGRQVELGGFLLGVRLLPGGVHALTTDGGYYDEFLRLVDLTRGTIVQQIPFKKDAGEALFLGLAVRADGRVFASGGGADRIYAYDYDPAAAAPLSPAPPISLPVHSYVAGIAFADATTLVAALQRAGNLALIDTTSGETIARVDLGTGSAPYDVAVAAGRREAYVSLWGGHAVAVVDLAAATPHVIARVAVGKNPEALLLDPPSAPRRLLVASTDSDTISVIDLASRRVTRTVSLARGEPTRLGSAPNHLALDPSGSHVYVADAGENCIDVLSTDSFARLGRIPTGWYPTAVAVLPSGGLVVTNAKGMGGGPSGGTSFDYGIMKGTLSVIDPAPGDLELTVDSAVVEENNQRPARVGARVECPEDHPCRWPLPPAPGLESPIQHVVLIVRENKTYDATLGDLERGNGDPDLVLFGERYTPNLHALARTFALGDNFYSNAEASIQGHQWTAGGTSNDFTEKAWLTTWGRETRDVIEFGKPISAPEQGYYFQHLAAAGVDYIDYGEIVGFGAGEVAIDVLWPGGLAFNLESRDRGKAEYIKSQVDAGILHRFTYMLLPNNHTEGLTPGKWTPEFMVADNDEATGMVVDALSHSPTWASTAVFIIEDDPQDGADHVEAHRSTLVVASPWVRHGAVVSSHYDNASLWRTIELLLGLPPQSQSTAVAAPMFDLFATEPDLTPFEYVPSNIDEQLNPESNSRLAALSSRLDFTTIDNAPGLGRILWEHMKGEPAPWSSMPLPVDLDDVIGGDDDDD